MTMNLGYALSSLILISALLAALVAQVRSRTFKPALFWTVVLLTSTAGTTLSDFMDRTLGDYHADDSGLGFLGGAALVAALLVLVVLATYLTTISRITLFWIAFVLTRPFGATFGDLLTKSVENGRLNLGTSGSSAVLAIIFVTFIAYTTRRERRTAQSSP